MNKIRRFVVTKFVKTCDELFIGLQELHISSKRKANLQKMLKFRQIVEILKTCKDAITQLGQTSKIRQKLDFKICEISESYLWLKTEIMWIYLKLWWKNSWNNIKWTYFWVDFSYLEPLCDVLSFIAIKFLVMVEVCDKIWGMK